MNPQRDKDRAVAQAALKLAAAKADKLATDLAAGRVRNHDQKNETLAEIRLLLADAGRLAG
ncbi:MAG: hypothetical protein KDH15_15765 [Rhodocyclaceae bacterium]|nr:hypothetical protein [Rhodocyclaceae bacterium]